MRLLPLLNAILRGHLDADGKRIVNLGTPTADGDAATKKYVDDHGGGEPVEFDDIPTEGSQKAARSGGIWSWVKSLLPSWLKPGTPAPDTGKARPLPKYLHALSFDDTYPAEAEAFYDEIAGDASAFGCSAIRRGGKLYRNYDWTFDDAAEFVVRVSGNESRFASVGVASVGAKLTEADVTSGRWSKYYKALPGMTLDGINEKGLVAEINVDGGPKDGWNENGSLHILAAVRYALDNYDSAAGAAVYLAANIKRPTGDMNFHFMIADATATYIVENGESHDITDAEENVLTNFNLFNRTGTVEHGGIERYLLLAGGAPITDAWFTNAYQEGNTWDSDFDSAAQHAAAIQQWAEQGETKEAHRNKTSASGKPWWHTKHTSEYDFATRTLKIAAQESEDWYVFAVDAQGVTSVSWDDVTDKPTEFPPEAHTHAQSEVTDLADALAAKRDLTDRDWKGNAPLKWTISGSTGTAMLPNGEYVYNATTGQWEGGASSSFADYYIRIAAGNYEYCSNVKATQVEVILARWQGDTAQTITHIGGYNTATATPSAEKVEVVADTLALTSEVPTTAAQVGAVPFEGAPFYKLIARVGASQLQFEVYDSNGSTLRNRIVMPYDYATQVLSVAKITDIPDVSGKADKADFALDSQGHPVGSYLVNLFSRSNGYLNGLLMQYDADTGEYYTMIDDGTEEE